MIKKNNIELNFKTNEENILKKKKFNAFEYLKDLIEYTEKNSNTMNASIKDFIN